MNKTTQNGSVIFWILIAVGLMAALSYAFMGSSRNSTGMITDTQADAYASEIIAYGNEVKSAVKRLQLRGCSDTEISFENNISSPINYTNPNSPTDNSCHVFDIAGGGITPWEVVPTSHLQSENEFNGVTPNEHWQQIYFWSGVYVTGIGDDCTDSSCNELLFIVPALKAEICQKINNSVGIPLTGSGNELQGDGISNYGMTSLSNNMIFDGDYFYINAGAGIANGGGAFHEGKRSGCFSSNNAGWTNPTYYQVLISR